MIEATQFQTLNYGAIYPSSLCNDTTVNKMAGEPGFESWYELRDFSLHCN